MDEDSQFSRITKAALAATGVGALAAVFFLPHPYGVYVAIMVLVLAVLLFGGYFLWRRLQAQREREQFASAIEAQTTAAPKAISDPTQRADLDRVRQKFQTGLQEFKSRGKDIYKLPWYVIIGESGSGKTEAIRHSGIDFPPGMQDELQGSGGTVNMDWWFTNRAIILDTAGSMLFNEARPGETPEWKEFLRLLKRARPHCPVNGLFLVLSVESLIRDSADTIAQKASRLAQQLDLIQRVLDVRFPVYLLVTKCDLLTGFREFFDNIDDPLLQHQIFGWSNPEPLDAHFRSDLMEEHLRSVASRLRRRRMALIRDISGTGRLGDTQQFFASTYQLGRGPAPARRLDELDSMFALPESVMRLAPRLQRYLETIFVAGEWSAKPVFLRGIYFTSSMREGKALDEAIALATGLPLDQLPEERSWEKNRAFFLRDLFHDKVFRESGLVTRATNTLKLLRQRQVAIFGTAAGALLLVLVLGFIAKYKLEASVKKEADLWKAGTNEWKEGVWLGGSIVRPGATQPFRFSYTGTNLLDGAEKLNLVEYHQRLKDRVTNDLAVSWIFKPMEWLGFGKVSRRPEAQRLLFEASVLRPLVQRTRDKLRDTDPPPGSAVALARDREALLSLLELEADGLTARANGGLIDPTASSRYLVNFLSYLTEQDFKPDPILVKVFYQTYSKEALRYNQGSWPPKDLLGGDSLASNSAIKTGLEKYQNATSVTRTNIDQQVKVLESFADRLHAYQAAELDWLTNAQTAPCDALAQRLAPATALANESWDRLQASMGSPAGALIGLAARYDNLATNAQNASAQALAGPLNRSLLRLGSEPDKGLFRQVKALVNELASHAADNVRASLDPRNQFVGPLDLNYLAPVTNATGTAQPAYLARWSLYTNACALASARTTPDEKILGDEWKQYDRLKGEADLFRTKLTAYRGPFREPVSNVCDRIARNAEESLQAQYVDQYIVVALNKLRSLAAPGPQDPASLTNAANWLRQIEKDLQACGKLPQASRFDPLRKMMESSRHDVLTAFQNNLRAALGFPLALNSANTLGLPELSGMRKQLSGLTNGMADPIWQGDRSGTLAAVSQYCGKLSALVSSMVKDDGTPAQWALYFVPPPSAAQDDTQIINVFRVVQASTGKKLTELTRADSSDTNTCFLGSVPINGGLTISFSKFADAPPSQNWNPYTDWTLVRLIQARQALPSGDGAHWRFQVSPDPNQKGKVTFEAQLTQPLPKPEDWP